MWKELFRETLPIKVMSDSSSGLAITARQGVGSVRHIDIKQMFTQGCASSGRVAGKENVADIGTKVLTCKEIEKVEKLLDYKPIDKEPPCQQKCFTQAGLAGMQSKSVALLLSGLSGPIKGMEEVMVLNPRKPLKSRISVKIRYVHHRCEYWFYSWNARYGWNSLRQKLQFFL